ncbi:RNB-like protein [Reticulomyxa filosa]|uniref:RNB-like protein n=1 Tax=Reticulomyxa filosa TaxID=46433 RepID=X6MWQ5_RETFI|nr:RNB-like protein [Reticulomyxa filosa]|eukprot:ETO17887.1 RNB-like protein [Reticulomyxa filosa]
MVATNSNERPIGENDEIVHRLKEKEQECQRMREELTQLRDECQLLRQQNEQLTVENKNLENELVTVANAEKAKAEHWQAENEHLQQQLALLKDMQQIHESHLRTHSQTHSHYEFLDMHDNDKIKEINTAALETQMNQLQQELQQTQDENNDLVEKLKRTNIELQKKDEILQVVTNKNDEMLDELVRLRSQDVVLVPSKQDLEQLQEEFNQYEQFLKSAVSLLLK